ncbi:hypothetical protein B2G71_09600 [Novosphingobium sp. PC22D]|nr:hypothetical protein B2G71_09600 [Novosphingobium sp. PC22D]
MSKGELSASVALRRATVTKTSPAGRDTTLFGFSRASVGAMPFPRFAPDFARDGARPVTRLAGLARPLGEGKA